MQYIAFLNRWGHIFHVILVVTDGHEERRLHSRICLSLEEARSQIEHWQQKYYIAADDVQDNSRIDLNELMKGMPTDFAPAQN